VNAHESPARFPSRRVRRTAFVFYALVLVTATHWPQVTIEGPIPRPDLVIHFAAYGLWSALLIACAWFGDALSWRNLGVSLIVGLVYACVDEATQAFPGLRRVVALDDALANMGGVLIAVLGAGALAASRLGAGGGGEDDG